jgi:glycerol-3-phosphate acyltransferase PlsY
MIALFAGAIAFAYVIGSFPSAYLAGRLSRGIDLRKIGSGNLGATNVYREVGLGAAIVVLLLDALKGWVAVALVPRWVGTAGNPWLSVALGAAAVLGHGKPLFLLWRGGGKGVATGAGVFLALAPVALIISATSFFVVAASTRYASAGSLAAAVAMPIGVAVTVGVQSPVFLASVCIAAFVIWAHRGNVRRLIHGQEKRLGKPGGGRRAAAG